MSKQFLHVTFEKTFDYGEFVHEYHQDCVDSIEQAAQYEKDRHDEGLSTCAEILAYEDNEYTAIFEVVEIGDVLEDGSLEVIQPDVGDIVQITTTYTQTSHDKKTSKTETYTRLYKRVLNPNWARGHENCKGFCSCEKWADYYQDISQAYENGIFWTSILKMIKNEDSDRKYTVEFLTPRSHHCKTVFTAKDHVVELFEKEQEAHFNAQHVTP